MKAIHRLTRLALTATLALAAACSAAAQGMRQRGSDPQQLWLKFAKELGLQPSYSADMDIQAMGMSMTSTLYHDVDKTRTEMTMPFMNLKMVSLQLTENGKTVSYTLFPDKKKYCLTPMEESGQGKLDYTLEDAGTEVYEGVACKKRRMTVKIPDQGTQVMDMLFSPAQKNMPVKMTANVQMKTENDEPPMTVTSVVLFKNYRFGAPDASLFIIPKDYTQAKDMQEIMMGGGLFGGFGGGQPGAGQQGQQPQGMTLPPEALQALKEAQAEAEKTEKVQGGTENGEAVRQGLQTLRGLLGR
jgi:hypothetical protein